MKTIGITGGIASGKSCVADFLKGFPHIDADQVARHVVAPGAVGLRRVVKTFGAAILQADGALNRARLRQIIAHDRNAQQTLNGILHPLIRAAIQEKLTDLARAGEPVAFVSAALMLETGSYRNYDAVLLITAPEEVRLARLLERDGMDERAARSLMAKQWDDERKRALATVEVINDGDLKTLEKKVWEALGALSIPSPGKHRANP